MKLLEGDRALVTGAAHGIGRGIAQALKEEGAELFAADLHEGDLSSLAGARRLAEEAIRRLGTVSIFVHSASPRETMLMKELARALGPRGIRVNAIAPGAIPGGGFQAPPDMLEKIALRRFGTQLDRPSQWVK